MKRQMILCWVLWASASGCARFLPSLSPRSGNSPQLERRSGNSREFESRSGNLPEIETKRLHKSPPGTAIPTAAIKILEGQESLPPGFFYFTGRVNKKLRIKLFAIPDFPSAKSPHIVIAALAAKGIHSYSRVNGLREEYQRRASVLGANAIFMLRNDPRLVFAVFVGDATGARIQKSRGRLSKVARKRLSGYKPVGPAHTLSLTNSTISLKTKRARCYAMTTVLNRDATWSDVARRGIFLELKSSDKLLGNSSLRRPSQEIENPDGLPLNAPQHGAYVGLRSFSNLLGCTSGATLAKIIMKVRGNLHVLGQGSAKVQFFERRISKAELAKKERLSAKRWEDARISSEKFHKREAERAKQRAIEREESNVRIAAMSSRQQNRGRAGASSSKSTTFTMGLKNECSKTVKMFIGDKPKYGSGTNTSIGSNTSRSFSGFAPRTYWIVDSSGNGISSYTVSAGSQKLKITSSCMGFVRR